MKIFKILFLLLLCIAVYAASDSDIWQHIADKNWIANYVHQTGFSGLILLLSFGAVFTACGGPRQLIAFTFGFAFGSVSGTLLCLLSTLAGAVCTYTLASWVFRQVLIKKMGRRYEKFKRFIEVQPFTKVLLLRTFPIGSNLFTNLLSGVTGIRLLSFMLASLLGYFPQTFIFALAGSGVGSASEWQLIVSILLGIVSMLLTHRLYRNYKQSTKSSDRLGDHSNV
ncbi:TVP38/TMEM64 family protein [Vibrio nitrifigilis]|uniref:TVP38/TMEM64 family membrane protein n=1 Tax=Vibrio nitrifigilis TaxID=2789781 RepID=A0ABS0GH30_9VIBR|nr:VTT domain-containing protein [Vibrio nitrifigilis]MBF9001662.1 VTT domain-containing protein [Vibrio nitrifigilis]